MDDFDKELENIEVALKQDHELHAIRRRFEESKEWEDHRRWHNENGGTPVLRIWDEPVPVQQAPVEEEAQEVHRRAIKVGGCDCQPRLPFMELTPKGDVITAGIPAPEAASTVYGTTPGANGTTTTYGTAPGPTESIYAAKGQQKDLYR